MYYLLDISRGEFHDLGSSFECELIPLSHPDELKSVQEEFKKRHPKADHYPYAFRFDELSRSSDDGEPSGTGGRALLSLLEQKQLGRCLIMVARFFGGTKLGIPRLRRAFVGSGEDAIAQATLFVEQEQYVYHLEISYSLYSVLEKNQTRYGYQLKNTSFDVNVVTDLCSMRIMDEPWEKMGLNPTLLIAPRKDMLLVEAKV